MSEPVQTEEPGGVKIYVSSDLIAVALIRPCIVESRDGQLIPAVCLTPLAALQLASKLMALVAEATRTK